MFATQFQVFTSLIYRAFENTLENGENLKLETNIFFFPQNVFYNFTDKAQPLSNI